MYDIFCRFKFHANFWKHLHVFTILIRVEGHKEWACGSHSLKPLAEDRKLNPTSLWAVGLVNTRHLKCSVKFLLGKMKNKNYTSFMMGFWKMLSATEAFGTRQLQQL